MLAGEEKIRLADRPMFSHLQSAAAQGDMMDITHTR